MDSGPDLTKIGGLGAPKMAKIGDSAVLTARNRPTRRPEMDQNSP
eukprot:CAMPEP_0174351494 /NCGR_PEP_ID=MMETSP0811_2-20130205/8882_1 /TAXON_ID=73025 ORGANISM="Eutreptiella gymnastica-like, Strain CCMP1594" /NCGR_SAMPLE_ID=MMETSP0811_2 /ASSEMBLY_ACC=CAM_ASM_000667 /LENGTH=44 /DNA_ID= /DNA_START= /DNA_END= /DNA_ORIENTATION=